MGREIGQKCMRNNSQLLVLAFFTVVASSPNLSTFSFRVQSYEKLLYIEHCALNIFQFSIISLSGIKTKSRSCMCGWGSVSSGVFISKSS